MAEEIKATTKVSSPCNCGKTIHYPIVEKATIVAKKKSIDDWYQMMVALHEEDLPYLSVDGKMYTPREIMEHRSANDSDWKKIKKRMM